MMNRIILIGNGFDLAHGLATGYKDFIDNYWTNVSGHIFNGYKRWLAEQWGSINDPSPFEDEFIQFEVFRDKQYKTSDPVYPQSDSNPYNEVRGLVAMFNDNNNARYEGSVRLTFKNRFFEYISGRCSLSNWVDIETEFYHWLKKIFKEDNCEYDSPVPLNKELELIKEELIEYLKFIQENQIKPELVKDCIQKAIFEPFAAKDISNGGVAKFKDFLSERMKFMATGPEEETAEFLNKYGYSYLDRHSDIDLYNEQIINRKGLPGLSEPLNYSKHIKNVYESKELVPDVYLLPDQILFLNFNYTNTADLYIPKGSEFKVNHIHGELSNDKNPIIFGYGDELDDDYKEIAKLNDNDYLKNIKSIRYLETDNYRKLLSFIDSAPFQIYIMGHSCGNSDRTLLNTLFEHKNCVSIKPFYYEKPDGTDNYIEIVQNISRNFNDMRLMRDRVVNKTYCRPLVPR